MAEPTTVLMQNTFASPKIVNAINANNEKALKALYVDNYHKIETLVLKNSGTKEQAKDIYQEAFITVWKNVKNNKFLPENETSINGYLYTIAKNKWMDYLRSPAYKKRVSYHAIHETIPPTPIAENSSESFDQDEKLTIAMKAFECLGEACKNLLTKFYFEKKSMKEIAIELQLDAASTRNKKYRCMQTLREMVSEMNVQKV